jgi:Ca2+-binding EF-hand superfamily protein
MQWFKDQSAATKGAGFTSWHKDASSSMTLAEFNSGVASFTPPMSPDKSAWAFKYFDCNGNGQVSNAEWDAGMGSTEFYSGDVMCPDVTTTTAAPISSTKTGTNTVVVSSANTLRDVWARVNRNHLKIVRENCGKMDLDGSQKKTYADGSTNAGHMGTVSYDEFVAFMKLQAGISETEAKDLFRVLDLNGNHHVSQDECHFNMMKFEKALQSLGPPETIVSDMDLDGNKILDRKEFSHVGELLPLDDESQLGQKRTQSLYDRLDKSGDGITAEDLSFSIPPTPVPTPGKGVTTATTTPKPMHSVATGERKDLSSKDLESYRGVPAVIQGRTELTLKIGLNVKLPENFQIANVIYPLFQSAFDKTMDCSLKKNGAACVSQSEAELEAETGETEPTYQKKTISLTYELDTVDGGAFQEEVVSRADEIQKHIFYTFKHGEVPWLAAANVTSHTRLTAEYYGMKAIGLPQGNSVVQHFGMMNNTQMDGSAPYTLAEDRRLAASALQVVI